MVILRALTLVLFVTAVGRPAVADERFDSAGFTPQARPALLEQSEQLRLEIQTLQTERAQYGIVGPIVMLAAGGQLALGAAYIYWVTSIFDEFPCHGSVDCEQHDNSGFRTAMVVVGAAGAVVALVGLVTLSGRLKPRNELGARIRTKRSQLQMVESRMRLGVLSGPQNLRGMTLGLAF